MSDTGWRTEGRQEGGEGEREEGRKEVGGRVFTSLEVKEPKETCFAANENCILVWVKNNNKLDYHLSCFPENLLLRFK